MRFKMAFHRIECLNAHTDRNMVEPEYMFYTQLVFRYHDAIIQYEDQL